MVLRRNGLSEKIMTCMWWHLRCYCNILWTFILFAFTIIPLLSFPFTFFFWVYFQSIIHRTYLHISTMYLHFIESNDIPWFKMNQALVRRKKVLAIWKVIDKRFSRYRTKKRKTIHVMQEAVPKLEPPFLWHPKSPCHILQKQSQTSHLPH